MRNVSDNKKMMARNTTVETVNGRTTVVYYKTAIVVFDKAEIVLNTGGWWTMMTRERMNRSSNYYNLGFRVYQTGKKWYVEYMDAEHRYKEEKIRLDRKTGKVTPVR